VAFGRRVLTDKEIAAIAHRSDIRENSDTTGAGHFGGPSARRVAAGYEGARLPA